MKSSKVNYSLPRSLSISAEDDISTSSVSSIASDTLRLEIQIRGASINCFTTNLDGLKTPLSISASTIVLFLLLAGHVVSEVLVI